MVLAGADGIATFQQAAEPIIATLSEDPITATAIGAIRALKERTESTSVSACAPALKNPEGPWPPVSPGPDLGPIPDGVYVHSVTEDELLAAGVEPGDAAGNAGKYTFTVQGDEGSRPG